MTRIRDEEDRSIQHSSYFWQRFSGTEIVDFNIVWIRHLHPN